MTAPLQHHEKLRPVRKADHSGYYSNNRLRLIKGGQDYFTLLEDLIETATESIHLQTYIYEADDTGRRIARALMRAAERKVKVAVLLDGYASQHFPFWLAEKFREQHIQLDFFYPLLKSKKFYFGRRLHHKVVVVDSSKVLVGGLNISDRYNDTVERKAWLDWAVYAEGDIAIPVKRICQRRSRINWNNYTNPARELTSFPDLHCDECRVRPRINDWVNRKMQIWNSYMEMFRKAQSEIIIMSPYFLPGNKFRKKIAEASARGVKVKVILGNKSDVKLARLAEQYLYPWLLRNKIEIYEYQKNVLHGKLALYDHKWVTLGSYNVNNVSAYASVELNLDVDNESFAQVVDSELGRIIREDCKKITINHYKKNVTLFDKFLHRSAYDISRIIFFLFTFYFRQRD